MEANSKIKFNIPILLLTWKRKENIKDLINILRRINASTIYVSSDGLNQEKSKPNEIRNIIDTRNYILKNIDWDCNIFLKFNNNNLDAKMLYQCN